MRITPNNEIDEDFESPEDFLNLPPRNPIITIILPECSPSLLQLRIPSIEDTISVNHNTARQHRVVNIDNWATPYPPRHNIPYFFGLTKQNIARRKNEKFPTDVAYISNKFENSNISIENFDDLSESEVMENKTEEGQADKTSTMQTDDVIIPIPDKPESEKNLTVLDDEITDTSSGWVSFCRICHGGESIGTLVAPCECKGSIAKTHVHCLERWLKQSSNNDCELCQHHFEVIRQPKYTLAWSILMFLRYPGEHYRELLLDAFGLLIYTPTAIASTYLLMILCDSITQKNDLEATKNIFGYVTALSAVFGMAIIDFTYSSWLVMTIHKHIEAWSQWYQNNSTVEILIPENEQ